MQEGLGAWILAVLLLADSCEWLTWWTHQDGVGGPLYHLVQRQFLQNTKMNQNSRLTFSLVINLDQL